jgi:predicted nucleic acid-binding Zn ribbon protein
LLDAAAALGVERAAREVLVRQAWADVVGEEAAAHSRPVAIRGRTLLVEVDEAVWVQELTARRYGVVQELNRQMGAAVLEEMRVRLARHRGDRGV